MLSVTDMIVERGPRATRYGDNQHTARCEILACTSQQLLGLVDMLQYLGAGGELRPSQKLLGEIVTAKQVSLEKPRARNLFLRDLDAACA